MIRYVKPIFTLFIFFCFIVTPLKAMQDGQSTVIVSVEDDYTNEPVESVLVRLLDNGSEIASGTTDLTGRTELVLSVTSNEEPELIPESFEVSESYPNPFEQSSSVNLQIEEAQEVQAEIYNIIGQRVASLQVNLTPGTYTLQSSLGHLAQGVYFLRILGTQSQTIKMTKVGERIFSGGSILNINPATFVTRNGPGMARLTLNGQTSRSLTLVTSKGSYDTFQQSIQVAADTTIALEMSRNNEVIVRVADETSPSQDVETTLMVEGDQFSQQITSPDTLSLKSGFYTLSADEDNTAAFSQDVEIASEDQTVTVLTQVKTLAENQLQLEGLITDETSGTPIDRAYIYLLNQTTSDTLSGPLFAGSDGVLDAIANLDGGPDLDLSILYRKAGYTDFEGTASVSLPDTLILNTTLQPAPAPTASFTVTGEQTVGQSVVFDATSSTGASGEELTYSWDFGNGKTGGGQTIGYVYSNSGSYDVKLTVVGDFGAEDQTTQSISIAAIQAAGTATLSGTIFTNEGEELEGVLVTTADGSVTGVSNPEGDVTLEGLDTGVPIVLTLTREGYSNQYVRTEIPAETNTAVYEANMLPRETPMITDQIEVGGQFEGTDGASVSIPIDGFVNELGETIRGEVEMTFTPLDIRDDGNLGAFPGSFSAVSTDGEQVELVSFGLAEFEFEQDGTPIQLAPGKKATIEIPYYLDMNIDGNPVQAGDQVPLWSLDESTGLWVEEGIGTVIASAKSPTGYTMRAEVTHFSWWNIDHDNTRYTAITECKIVDRNGLPTLDIPKGGSCFVKGATGSGCSGRSLATTQIPSGSSVSLALSSDCNTTLIGSSSGGSKGNQSVSGEPGEVKSVTLSLQETQSNNQILTTNDFVTDDLNQDTDSYLLDPEDNEFIIIELEKFGNGRPISTLTLYGPDDSIIDEIELSNSDSFSAFKKRLLFKVENPDLHRIDITHSDGNDLFYTLRIQPVEEINLDVPIEFSVQRGISRYLYYVPDADYIIRTEDGGTLFQEDFNEVGELSATGDSGGPLNLFSLRQNSVYVIEHTNIDGPEVIQKEFMLEGQLRENLTLKTENFLSLDLIQSGESFKLDPKNSDYVIVEIDTSPGENISATLNLLDPNGTVIDSKNIQRGTYRERVVSEILFNGLYEIEVIPTNGSAGNYSIKTYSPEELILDQPSNYTIAGGSSYFHSFTPDRDIVIRGTTSGKLLDNNLDELANMFEFSSPGRRPTIGRLLTSGETYFIAQDFQFVDDARSRTFTISEVKETEIDFDGGQFVIENEFTNEIQVHVYTFEAEPNSGVISIFEELSVQLSNDGYYIGKIGNGTFYDLDNVLTDQSDGRDSESRSILQASQRDKYAVIVQSGGIGTYNMQVDIAEALPSYTISPDLSCAGATLRNIHAAAFAAPENSTITLCEGVYEVLIPIEIQNHGVSMVGTDRENSIIRGSDVYFMRVDGDNVSFSNFTIESSARAFPNAPSVYVDANNFAASGINIEPITGQGSYDTGLEIRGNNAVIQQNVFINAGDGTAIELAGISGITIDNNEFLNHGFAIRSSNLSGDISISNNDFAYNNGTAVPAALELNPNRFDTDGLTNRLIESNTIDFENESVQVITANQLPQQAVNDVIRGNTISWIPRSANDAAVLAEVGRETSSSLVEQNTIRTIGTGGGIGVRVTPTNSLFDTGSIDVQNNVITDTFRGIEILQGDWYTTPVKIFNNSIRTSTPTFNDAMVGLRIAGLSNSISGPVQVQVVNNIFQGRIGQNDNGVEVYSGFEIDSDYNLFHNVQSAYFGGITSTGNNDIIDDPQFLNDMLELGASSPALDSGATSADYDGIPDMDINGITRPQGAGIDRGAREKVD